MGSVEPKVATYVEFAETVLPRIKRRGPGAFCTMGALRNRLGVLLKGSIRDL